MGERTERADGNESWGNVLGNRGGTGDVEVEKTGDEPVCPDCRGAKLSPFVRGLSLNKIRTVLKCPECNYGWDPLVYGG